MWSEIDALLDIPALAPRVPKFNLPFRWYGVAAATAMLVAAVAIGLTMFLRSTDHPPRSARASWAVEGAGRVRIDGDRIRGKGRLAIGETLETGDASRAKITVSDIGEVELDPNSRIRLVQTQESEHRLALDRGLMRATISAPPRLFFVDTPAVEAIDLGCVYTLQVDDAGASLLHVTVGWVALVRSGREVYVPRYAKCQARPGIGPGTPYFEDASEPLVRALEEFDFENGGAPAFATVLAESRPRDTFTLWHLLSRVEGEQRVQALNRMIELVGLPKGITREGTLRLDQNALDAWREAMDTVWF